MSVNIKENGNLTTVANNISITQANWNDRGNTNKNTCIKNQPATLKTLEEVSANTDENALVGANAVKELSDSLENLPNQIKEIGTTTIEVAKGSDTYGSEVTATGTVTFKKTYTEIPSVFISPHGLGAMNIQFVAHSITTTGFKIYVINRGGSAVNARFNYLVL